MVTASDDDAALFPLSQCMPNGIEFGDEQAHCSATPACAAFTEERAKARGELNEEHRHTYRSAGLFDARVVIQSGSQCPHPFGSRVEVALPILVADR